MGRAARRQYAEGLDDSLPYLGVKFEYSWTPQALKLLVIEDNPRLSEAMAKGLRSEGFAVDLAVTAGEGLKMWRAVPYDAVVLDLMLPDQHGLTTLETMRDAGSVTPVLILTALDAIEDRVRVLDTRR